MRYFLLWRQWFRRHERTSSSATARSDKTTAAAPTAGAATFPKPRLATDPPRNGGSWTAPSGRRGSAKTPPKGQVYRSRSSTPGLDRLRTTRRVIGDIGAIVAVVASVAVLTFGVLWLWRAM